MVPVGTPCEEQVGAGGIDFGDAERITDGGVGRRAASLMQNSFLAGEADNVLHGEKEGRIVLARDEHELVLDLLHDSGRRSIRVTALQPFPGQPFEPRLRVFAVGRDLVGIFVGQFLEAES